MKAIYKCNKYVNEASGLIIAACINIVTNKQTYQKPLPMST